MKPRLRAALLALHSCPLSPPGTPESGGMNVYLRNLAAELGKLGMAVDIFTRSHASCPSPVLGLGPGARLVHLAVAQEEETTLGIFQHLGDFACAVHSFAETEGIAYDLAHSHYWLSARVGAVLRGWWRVPHLAMFHTLARAKNLRMGTEVETQLREETEQQVMRETDLIIAGTPQEKQDLVRLYGVLPGRVRAIPCGVDRGLFRPLEQCSVRQALGLDGEKIVLFVGRLDPLKGLDLLLRALALARNRDRARLLLVGEGDGEHQRLKTLAGELGLEEKVSFLGAVEHRALPAYYNAADVCVLPSYYETFGMAVLESLACGTPVIATPVGYAPYLLRHGGNGFLLRERTPQALAELLDACLEREWDGLGFHGQALSRLSWSHIARRIFREYRRLVEGE